MRYVGSITLNGTCDLTDPCYDKDTWCRYTVNVKPGQYNCYVIESLRDEGGTITHSWIVHEDFDNKIWPLLDTQLIEEEQYCCGVDAGLFGYFDDKPDFGDREWFDLCDTLRDESVFLREFDGRDGFFTTSGYGDGGYDVVTFRRKYDRTKEVVAVGTRFI